MSQTQSSGMLKWEMATQTDPIEIVNPDATKPVSVHDLVTELHEKQKQFDVHEQTMRQVQLREETLKQEHETRMATLNDRITSLSKRLEERDKEIETMKT